MLAFAMFMPVGGAVIVMSSAYVVSCTESGGSGISKVYMLKSMGERTPPDLNCRFVVPECCVCHVSLDVVCDVSEYGVWIQPARGWCVTVKRDCANCIHLTLPLQRPGPLVFLGSQSYDPAAWLAEHQLLA